MDMDMDMDGKFHIHGKPAISSKPYTFCACQEQIPSSQPLVQQIYSNFNRGQGFLNATNTANIQYKITQQLHLQDAAKK